MASVEITVVYDNYPSNDKLRTGHGFSCIVKGFDKTILFDTGWSGRILLGNMQRLGLAPGDINVVVLSHMHWDHIGGLDAVLHENAQLTVHLPRSFSAHLKNEIHRSGATVVETEYAHTICPGVRTTGVLTADTIGEQALCVDTAEGTSVITGCAHPGIVNILRHTTEQLSANVSMALGGFHLSGIGADHIRGVIAEFKNLNVRAVAPCHCSGDLARRLFKEAYAKNCYAVGVGWQLTLGRAKRKAPEIK